MGIQRLDDLYKGQCHALRMVSEYLQRWVPDIKKDSRPYFKAEIDFMGRHPGEFVTHGYPQLYYRNHKRGKPTKTDPKGSLVSCEAYVNERFAADMSEGKGE